MKELSIEEKAKVYDEALKAAIVAHKDEDKHLKATLERIFPELKESEDERIRKAIKKALQVRCGGSRIISDEPVTLEEALAWLEKQGEKKPIEWSEEDEKMINNIIDYMMPMPIFFTSTKGKSGKEYTKEFIKEAVDWLKSLRPQNRWKPSEEMLEALYRAIPKNVMEISEDEMLLDKLYQGLKYGRVLSEK